MTCRVPRSFLLTAVTLLAVVSWTTTLSVAAPTFIMNSTTTAPSPASGGGNNSTSPNVIHDGRAGLADEEVIATAWYPGWLFGTFPPSAIPWSKYNMMTYAFALTSADSSRLNLNGGEQLLTTFVQQAQSNGVKALLSVGGWTGSQYYSSAVATAANRTAFVNAITTVATQYNLDGIDFDWEYPNQAGIGCNTKSTADTANFLTFLQQLKADPIGSSLILTAAVGLTPFMGTDGVTPIADASPFSDVLDFIAIMNYDVFGSFSTSTGPNAPLQDSCASPSDQHGAAQSGVAAWTAAKVPANQLLLGLASYGHSYFVDNTVAKTTNGTLNVFSPFDKSKQPLGQGETAASAAMLDTCGNPEGISGVFYFNGLIEAGFLDANGNPGDGINYTFDNCSQTPFLYQQTTDTFISFDDVKSFAAKGSFINSQGLAGFAVWHVAGDSTNNILLNSVQEAMGISSDCPSGNSTTTIGGTGGDAGSDGGSGSGGGTGSGEGDGRTGGASAGGNVTDSGGATGVGGTGPGGNGTDAGGTGGTSIAGGTGSSGTDAGGNSGQYNS